MEQRDDFAMREVVKRITHDDGGGREHAGMGKGRMSVVACSIGNSKTGVGDVVGGDAGFGKVGGVGSVKVNTSNSEHISSFELFDGDEEDITSEAIGDVSVEKIILHSFELGMGMSVGGILNERNAEALQVLGLMGIQLVFANFEGVLLRILELRCDNPMVSVFVVAVGDGGPSAV
jgi:hypothetical protein